MPVVPMVSTAELLPPCGVVKFVINENNGELYANVVAVWGRPGTGSLYTGANLFKTVPPEDMSPSFLRNSRLNNAVIAITDHRYVINAAAMWSSRSTEELNLLTSPRRGRMWH